VDHAIEFGIHVHPAPIMRSRRAASKTRSVVGDHLGVLSKLDGDARRSPVRAQPVKSPVGDARVSEVLSALRHPASGCSSPADRAFLPYWTLAPDRQQRDLGEIAVIGLHQSRDPGTSLLYLRRPWKRHEVMLAVWTRTKGIYRFDEHLRAHLDNSFPAQTSSAALRRLPEQCIYIEIEKRYNGIYAHTDVEMIKQAGETYVHSAFVHLVEPDMLDYTADFMMQFLIVTSIQGQRVWVEGGDDFHDDRTVVADFYQETNAGEPQRVTPEFAAHIMGYATHLCSGEAEIRNADRSPIQPHRTRKSGKVQRWNVDFAAQP